jgi:hypothetical protein
MPIGSIFLGLALLFGVGLFITRPFWRPEPAPAESMTDLEALQAQKAMLLDEIRTLEFDHETGKMPDEIFQTRREKLVLQTADLLREIDRLAPVGEEPAGEPAAPSASGQPLATGSAVEESVRAEIEAAVAQLRRAQTQPEPAKTALAAVPAGNAAGSPPVTGQFCSQCGNPREGGDKFCAYCGHKF